MPGPLFINLNFEKFTSGRWGVYGSGDDAPLERPQREATKTFLVLVLLVTKNKHESYNFTRLFCKQREKEQHVFNTMVRKFP